MSKEVLRDFIYLDIERIRSYVAQLDEGLLSESSQQREHDIGMEGSAEGGIPFLGKGSGKADYHYIRTQLETRSLHDHIFEELFSKLKSRKLIKELSSKDVLEWSEEKFSDGMFILSDGLFKFVDYRGILRVLEVGNNIFEILQKSIKETGLERQKKEGELQRQKAELKKLPIKEIATFVNMNYEEGSIRIKLFPYKQDTTRLFIGNADKNSFRYLPSTIRNTYGPIVDADWKCVLQVNKGRKSALGSYIGETGNQIEDALDQVIEQMSHIDTLIHGVDFPIIAMTPIAIYRSQKQ